MTIEAMKQALEALENAISDDKPYILKSKEAITALRQAIEFAEMVQKGTKAWADTPDDWVDDLRGDLRDDLRGGAEKLEPVGWMKVWRDGSKNFYDHEPPMFGKHETYALYTTPPKREWVGLTDEEVGEIEDEYIVDYRIPAGSAWNFAKDIEAKLKEKNT